MGITSLCNSNCIYCYAKWQRHEGEVLDRDVLLKFMAEAPAVGIKSVALIGDGSPFGISPQPGID